MKKKISLLLVLALLFVLPSCEESGGVSSTESESAMSETYSEVSSSVISAISSEVSSPTPRLITPPPYSETSSDTTSRVRLEDIDIHHLFTEEDLVPVIPETLPVYHDGDIKLIRGDKEGCPENRERRCCYYWITPATKLYMLLDESIQNLAWSCGDYMPGDFEWREQYFGSADKHYVHSEDEEPEEMPLVSYIKFYNIPRETMEQAVELLHESLENVCPIDTSTEYWEVPNWDIVYTFDNDIINEYYRYA